MGARKSKGRTSDSRSLRRPACEDELMDMIILEEWRWRWEEEEGLLRVGGESGTGLVRWGWTGGLVEGRR